MFKGTKVWNAKSTAIIDVQSKSSFNIKLKCHLIENRNNTFIGTKF